MQCLQIKDYQLLYDDAIKNDNFDREIKLKNEIENFEKIVINSENEIDKMVYELYGLSDDEIKIVGGQLVVNLNDIIDKISLSKEKQVSLFIGLLLIIMISNFNNQIMIIIVDLYKYIILTTIFLFGNIVGTPIYDFFKDEYNGLINRKNTKAFLKN